jgi:hypothetical protein
MTGGIGSIRKINFCRNMGSIWGMELMEGGLWGMIETMNPDNKRKVNNLIIQDQPSKHPDSPTRNPNPAQH